MEGVEWKLCGGGGRRRRQEREATGGRKQKRECEEEHTPQRKRQCKEGQALARVSKLCAVGARSSAKIEEVTLMRPIHGKL